jgi:tRNA (uracil-5-)-methyltransferase
VGLDETKDPICYSSFGQGPLPETLPIAADAINECMPLLLAALRADPVLRRGVTSVAFLATAHGRAIVACLTYRLPLDADAWAAAAKRALAAWAQASSLAASLLGQAKRQRIDVGPAFVTECYALQDGRRLAYKHVHGHFSNPNAYACAHTLNFLADVVRAHVVDRAHTDLLELYCGNGNHTVALAPLFRAALAVEINPILVAAAESNLAANGVTNCAVQVCAVRALSFGQPWGERAWRETAMPSFHAAARLA